MSQSTGQDQFGESKLKPCDPQYKIICEGLFAKNRKSQTGQCTDIFFSFGEEPPIDRWKLKCFSDSPCYGIRNEGSGNWATAKGGRVLGCPDFDEKDSKWRIEFVLQCKGELAWTKGVDNLLYLTEFLGNSNQLFEIAFIGRDLDSKAGGEVVNP
ncbi:hypothetical protein AGABI1DRAFT_107705 [Agaricus bisporus var. burnettii JB137-S8]|uniref:Uncharacterized protein n=1 Tax=Agaricus bisporus var. burnettii (strain JB137-S8 / ATCC MYA-4627 / FGSC 10392) TaxID=597362 RepID=K5WR81_AGABU|nr:uncharacterized protein AGABI1DRAFT_107705 [Agaricus bisporus var. burnettii JB137-S8]EKM77891.1 hypothetical protein AGABI1DRAFT_107705 [Agaricus bisporus var. burnettii JB137-S8]